jgi:hydrogenase maturation protease
MSLMQPAASKRPCLVLAIGNPSRGDDAFGPVLAERLQSWLSAQHQAIQDQIDLIVEQQLVVEHVLDLQGRQRVLFIDAAAQGAPGAALQTITAQAQPSVQSHTCTPAQLLALYQTLLSQAPPDAQLLTITGHNFELDAPLSDTVQSALPQAWLLLQDWLNTHA